MQPAPSPSVEFEPWVASVRPRLVRLAAGLLKDLDEAENVVQATLLAVWQVYREGAAENLDAYARRAVWMNALRLRARRREWTPVEAGAGEAEQVVAEMGDELTSWELEQAILGLPPAQQVVIRMRFYGGLSFKEIGHSLEISMNTAASRCRYALDALRSAFRPDEQKEE